MRTANTLIRLRGCAGWSEYSLGAHVRRYVFLRCYLYLDSESRSTNNSFPEPGPVISESLGQTEISALAPYQPLDSHHTLLEDIFKTARALLDTKTRDAKKSAVSDPPTDVTTLKENGTLAAMTGISTEPAVQVLKGSGRSILTLYTMRTLLIKLIKDWLAFIITKTRLFKYIVNFTNKNWKFSDKNSDIFHISAQNIGVYIIFHISAQNIDCGYSLEPPRRKAVLTSTQSLCFWAEIRKIMYTL